MKEMEHSDFYFIAVEDITINETFKNYFPPQKENERAVLIQSIKDFGIESPLKVWSYQGQLTLIDGHNRLEVAKELGIPNVPIQKMYFDNEEEVIYFILQEQLGRRQLSPEQMERYIVIRYMDILEKKTRGNQYTKSAKRQNDAEHNSDNLKASEIVAKEVEKSASSIERTVAKWTTPFNKLKEYGYPITDEIKNDFLFDRITVTVEDLNKLISLAEYNPVRAKKTFNNMFETKKLEIPKEESSKKKTDKQEPVIEVTDAEIEKEFNAIIQPNWFEFPDDKMVKVKEGYDGVVLSSTPDCEEAISILYKFETLNKETYPFQGFAFICDSDYVDGVLYLFSKEKNNFVGKLFNSILEYKYTFYLFKDKDLEKSGVKEYIEEKNLEKKEEIREEIKKAKIAAIEQEHYEERMKEEKEEEDRIKEKRRLDIEELSKKDILDYPTLQIVRNVTRSDILSIEKHIKTGKLHSFFKVYNNQGEFLYYLQNANTGSMLVKSDVDIEAAESYSGYVNSTGIELLKKLELYKKKEQKKEKKVEKK